MKRDSLRWWKLATPEDPPRPEAAGLEKDEADFVSRYLALADELLKDTFSAISKKAG